MTLAPAPGRIRSAYLRIRYGVAYRVARLILRRRWQESVAEILTLTPAYRRRMRKSQRRAAGGP